MPAPTLSASGSTLTDGTEQSLTNKTSGGTYVFGIDVNPLANGDTIELRIYTKVLSSSTKRVAYKAVFSNAQGDENNKYSVPVLIDQYIEITLKRTGGSDHTYDWALLEL